jgi:hypothetical protein
MQIVALRFLAAKNRWFHGTFPDAETIINGSQNQAP